MTASDISNLRRSLTMSKTEFARIVGVDERTITRWEAGTTIASGTSLAVLAAFREKLLKSDAREAQTINTLLRSASGVGGLGYLIVRLLDGWTDGCLNQTRASELDALSRRLEEAENLLTSTQSERDDLAQSLSERHDLHAAVTKIQTLLGIPRA